MGNSRVYTIRMGLAINTHLFSHKLAGVSKVTSEKPIGKFGTNVQTSAMSGSKIESGVDSRNSMSMAKSGVGNPNTKLGAIPEQKEADSISSNIRTSRNFSERMRRMGCAK